jgi:hydrogenase nickel incorporation protein HypA/HybF
MHELAVTQGILDVAVDAAKQAGADRILAIDLVIGDLSGMVDDSIQFYFDILGRDTLAQGATLRFRREPAIATCLDCGDKSEVSPPLAVSCPACGSFRLRVTGGREFRVESIEVDGPGG